jgi:hypothetical protein
MHNHNYNKPCGCKDKKIPCGCHEPEVCGCSNKYDFLCSFYSGIPLNPIGITPGLDGNTVVRMLVQYFEQEIADIQIDPTVLKSIGGKIDIYKGLSDGFVHEIKSIQGQPNEGVIVENIQATPNDCNDKGDYINVRIDRAWLTDFLNEWILTVNLCPLIANCGETPIQTPVVTDIPFSIGNRAVKTFTLTDFTSHYTDPQSDPLASIRLTGNVVGYKLNGVAYVADTEVTAANITAGQLTYTGDNVDTLYTYTTPYQAKDSQGNWSNTANIIATVAAKQFIVFSPTGTSLIREVSNTKTATVNFSNATGQLLTTGQVLHLTGTAGNLGYLKITVQTGMTLIGSGSFTIVIDSIPTATQANQTINYTIDGSTGNVSLTYNSNPVTSDVVIALENRGEHSFTTAEFVAAYFDYDGDPLTEIRATSNVSGYEYDSTGGGTYVPYVVNTWIPVNDIARLKYTAANQNTAYSNVTPWQGKDAQGNISL